MTTLFDLDFENKLGKYTAYGFYNDGTNEITDVISGSAEFFKRNKPDIKIVGIEPASSPLLTRGYAGSHKIQGIGANFIPEILKTQLIDEIVTVSDEDAYEYARKVAKCEGIFVGISSGAALCAATKLAKQTEMKGKKIVVIFPDGGGRYLSTPDFI